jgi:hypothetical protein
MNGYNEHDKGLEELLDSALVQYGAAEPLHGLEERVLGRLRAGEKRRPGWFWTTIAAAVAVLLVMAALLGTQLKPHPAPPTGAAQEVVRPVSPANASQPLSAGRPMNVTKPLPRPIAPPEVASATALPKREVFPTPTPPSEQERLLAKYLRVTPRAELEARIERRPLEFHEDPLSIPEASASPQKNGSNGAMK